MDRYNYLQLNSEQNIKLKVKKNDLKKYNKNQSSLNDMLNPLTLDTNDREIVLAKTSYEYLIDEENPIKGKIIHLSLLNLNMIDLDYLYFKEEDINVKEVYKPYYYGLDIFIDYDENHYTSKGLKKILENKLDSEWFILELIKDKSFSLPNEFINKYKSNYNDYPIEEILNDYKRVSNKIEEIKVEFAKKSENTFCGFGNVTSIMSPIKTVTNIVINIPSEKIIKNYNDLINKVNSIFNNKYSKLKTGNSLNSLFLPTDVEQVEIDVFNIGQANFIQGIIDKKISFLFDAGVPNSTFKNCISNPDLMIELNKSNPILNNIFKITKIKPNYCFISHWHDDHIKGYFVMNKDNMLNAQWIMPTYLGNEDTNKARLSLFLKKNRIAYEIYGNQNKKIFSNDSFELYRGKQVNGFNKKTDINSDGLILLILEKCILPGDSGYMCWPLELKDKSKNITHLVVPHHGGYVDLTDKIRLPKFNTNTKKIAYLSTGYSEDISKFPNDYHKNYLTIDCKFTLYNTRDLNSKNKYRNNNLKITPESINFPVIR